MAHFDRAVLLQQGPIAFVMLIGYSGLYLFLYWLMLRLGMDRLRAALLGYTFRSTAVPIYGLTVLVPIYGNLVAAGIVGLAALITNLAQVSLPFFCCNLPRPRVARPNQIKALRLSPASVKRQAIHWCGRLFLERSSH